MLGFNRKFRTAKKKNEHVYYILFPFVFQLVKEMQGRDNKTRGDWERGRGMGSRAFHFCISLYIASYQC